MAILDDVTQWQKIYEDLAITAKESVNQAKLNDPKRIDEILDMISGFRDFCLAYVDEINALSEHSDLQPDKLKKDVDETLQSYWNTLSLAVQQHIPGQEQYSQLLSKSYEALTGLIKELNSKLLNFKMDDVHIVLYFFEGKGSAKAIRFPFGSTRLIGIPLGDAKRGDWMSIPHELGHHVYWNARFSSEDKTLLPAPGENFTKKEIEAAIKTAIQKGYLKDDASDTKSIGVMLDAWTEEIFADVVGAFIAGQKFVDGAWKMILISSPVKESGNAMPQQKEHLFFSDGEHPMDYLRPYIRHYATGENDGTFVNQWGTNYGNIDNYTKLVSNETQETESNTSILQKIIGSITNLVTSKDNQPTVISISTLRLVSKSYVDNILARLQTIESDKLIKGCSSLEQLNEFINEVNPDKKTQILASLLTPIILEKREYWTCANGHINSSTQSICPTCGLAHHWWNYFIR